MSLLGNGKLSIFYHFSLFGLVAQGAPPPYPQNVDKKRVFFFNPSLIVENIAETLSYEEREKVQYFCLNECKKYVNM